ncbi:HDIG domain-containing metalloprotein [Methanothermococcus sp.]|uniref:HDIG domain-containing metalloprotein n=1 Tax=Methanothermococcus sp. TaxID=2614238 RepID=UPI0025E2338A|nr:HDIG domain-containing metalloprotein [Methanothermococcus sp.]
MKDLINLAEKIENKDLRDKVINFIKNPLPTHEDIEDTKITLEDSPASIKWHHKYRGGLIEHTLATTKMALKMAEALEEIYDLNIDKDLIIAGGLLHDIMKPQNYIEDKETKKYDHIQNFHLEHLTLAVAELYKQGFPMELIKIVASHHGEYGAMRPDSIEGWLLHYADNIDASLNDIAIRICQARARDMGIDENEIYSLFTPLKIYEIRKKEGKDALKNKLNEIFNSEEE